MENMLSLIDAQEPLWKVALFNYSHAFPVSIQSMVHFCLDNVLLLFWFKNQVWLVFHLPWCFIACTQKSDMKSISNSYTNTEELQLGLEGLLVFSIGIGQYSPFSSCIGMGKVYLTCPYYLTNIYRPICHENCTLFEYF